MKKLHTLIFIALIGFIGHAQIINIPDAAFKTRLLQSSTSSDIARDIFGASIKIDANDDGNIQVSEALLVYRLNVSYGTISDLTGIAGFTNLKRLYCEHNQLTSLNVTTLTNLEIFHCHLNQIASTLDVSMMPNLKDIDCSDNNLTTLNITGLINIEYLFCNTNHLTTINVTNLIHLKQFFCAANQLTSLNVNSLTTLEKFYFDANHIPNINISGLINLTELGCSSNQMPSIDVSTLTQLQALGCADNLITSLNVSGLANLLTLDCASNPISSLDLTDLGELLFLQFEYCPITSIDLSPLHNLESLYCAHSQLTTLDLSSCSNLFEFDCQYTPITTLNMKNGSNEDFNFLNNPNLEYICADESQLQAVQNMVTASLPGCHVNTYCSFTPGGTYYTIQGNNRYDSNNNGCDSGDINFPNLKLSVSDGTNTGNLIPDDNGNYQYDVQAGSHTLTPVLENPSYFTISPSSATVAFPATTSPSVQNFCLTANGVHNDLEVTIFPLQSARPGFNAYYKIIYKNKGNTIQNGNIVLDFFDPIMDLILSNPSFTSQATNSLTWDFSNLLPFETRQILVAFNLNSPLETPALNAGNIIDYTATITGATDETASDNISELTQTVVNSLDPNDKTCTEGNFLLTNEVGKYLHYIIRFENSGTANAENIVVKDIIDTTRLDIATLIPLNGSHSFETKISSTNQVEFIFQNINLPFDDANNDGYVAFKIKSLPTLVDGNVINNTANIYFDYNAPIITNTNTVNVYNPLATPDFEFGTVFTLSPVPAKNSLTVTTKLDVVISSVTIYNTLGQLVQVITNPTETIDVSGLKTGSYFIKIISDKGTASSKFIKE